jgi:hypothetical protein
VACAIVAAVAMTMSCGCTSTRAHDLGTDLNAASDTVHCASSKADAVIQFILDTQSRFDRADPERYWTDILYNSGMILWTAFLTSSEDEQGMIVRCMVDSVGRDGGSNDFRLLYADSHLSFPLRWTLEDHMEALAVTNSNIPPPMYRHLLCEMAKYQAKRMLRDRLFLFRYYQAVRWNKSYLSIHYPSHAGISGSAGITFTMLHEAKGDDWWWYARNMIVLTYAVDRMDLLERKGISDIDAASESLEVWFRNTLERLNPSPYEPRWKRAVEEWDEANFMWVPDAPLPEWGAEPVPVGWVRLKNLVQHVYADVATKRADAEGVSRGSR